jgi:hypothetical protein
MSATGGTVTQSGSYTIHTFTGSGQFTLAPTWKTVIAGWEVGSINYKPNRMHKFFMKLLLGWKWNG